MKELCARFWNIRAKAAFACAALALLLPAASARAEAPDFREGMSHTEVRRHGGEAMARGDVLAGVRHGGATWS